MRLHLSTAHPSDFASIEQEELEASLTSSKKKSTSKSSHRGQEAMDTGVQQLELPAMYV